MGTQGMKFDAAKAAAIMAASASGREYAVVREGSELVAVLANDVPDDMVFLFLTEAQ